MKPFYTKVCEGQLDESGTCVIFAHSGPDQSVEFSSNHPVLPQKIQFRQNVSKSCEVQIVQKILHFGRCTMTVDLYQVLRRLELCDSSFKNIKK